MAALVEEIISDQIINKLIEADEERKPIIITIDFSKDNMTQEQKDDLYDILPLEKQKVIDKKEKIRIEVIVTDLGEGLPHTTFHLSNNENSTFTIPTKSIESIFINPDDEWITEESRGPDSDGDGADYGGGKWSLKYKRSINCNRPKGFSQKQYCKSLFKKKSRGNRGKSPKKKRTKKRRGYGRSSTTKRRKRKGGHNHGLHLGGKKLKSNKTEKIISFKRGPRKSKYTAIVQHKKTKKKRSINFGHKDYPQYKDSTPLGYYSYKNHGTKKRKNAYYSRHSGTRYKAKAIKKELRKSRGKYTPKILSHIYLW
ncbi:MAG: hypothetical protein CMG00_07685 [Candidatus Marinimicrobia bacterium]|nr:hypothetical protein [Candidatus Neomarinimicrobiota bacterium]